MAAHRARLPQATNSFDCAVYAVAYAYYIVTEQPMPEFLSGETWRAVLLRLRNRSSRLSSWDWPCAMHTARNVVSHFVAPCTHIKL